MIQTTSSDVMILFLLSTYSPILFFFLFFFHFYCFLLKTTLRLNEKNSDKHLCVYVCGRVSACTTICSPPCEKGNVCVLEHLNHRGEIRFNYTCNNFQVPIGPETICMLISMTAAMTCNKDNICCLIKPDIRTLQQSAFAICPEITCQPRNSFWEVFWHLVLVM